MNRKDNSFTPEQNDIEVMQNSIPVKMLFACLVSCFFGIALMALSGYYHLMWVFISILVCVLITTPLLIARKISIETACLAPMLLLCFVYTPLSWFTFDGLLGSTPYLSILFATLITLTYYRKIQTALLSLYAALMLGLTIHWLANRPDVRWTLQVINILAAYVISATLIVCMVEGVKRKNLEINKHITDISMHDELTGMLNRRASKLVLAQIENAFAEKGTEYAVVMMDLDRFKNINDLYGHHLGDSALKSLTSCIQMSIRTSDYAFRYGGDEFLLLLPNVDDASTRRICTRIETALHELRGYAFPVSVSLGFALRSESTTQTATLELADQRMYSAKKSPSQPKPSSN